MKPTENFARLKRPHVVAARWRAPPSTALGFGEILDAHVEYRENRHSYKRRPVVVLSLRRGEVLVLACTTLLRKSPRFPVLRDWVAAGLAEPTTVALRPFWLPRAEVLGPIGQLSEHDAVRVATLLGQSSSLQTAAHE